MFSLPTTKLYSHIKNNSSDYTTGLSYISVLYGMSLLDQVISLFSYTLFLVCEGQKLCPPSHIFPLQRRFGIFFFLVNVLGHPLVLGLIVL